MSEKKLPPKVIEEIEQDRGSASPNIDAEAEKAKQNRLGFFSKLPAFLKSIILKSWFAGSICYFVVWGIFDMSYDGLDTIAIMGVLIGILLDLIVFPVLRMTDGLKQDAYKYVLFDFKLKIKPLKYVISLFCSIAYATLVCFLVALIYGGINVLAGVWGWVAEDAVLLGVEPILYGIFFALVDLALLTVKNLVLLVFQRRE